MTGERLGIPRKTRSKTLMTDQKLIPVDLRTLKKPKGYKTWPLDLNAPPVAIGQRIYLRTALYISHGRDDVAGGLATVSDVTLGGSAGKLVPFVETFEVPNRCYNWELLAAEQDKLKARHGDEKAHPDPDNRFEFNNDGF